MKKRKCPKCKGELSKTVWTGQMPPVTIYDCEKCDFRREEETKFLIKDPKDLI